MAKNENMIKAEIIKILPDNWSYSERYQLFQKIADEYKKKSAKEISTENRKFREKMYGR